MKKLFLVANWKSHKTITEAISWMDTFLDIVETVPEKEIIICPPSVLLGSLSEKVKTAAANSKLIFLGAQDISPFEQGAFTGEESAVLLKGFCTYSIIGHSERRQYFQETDELLAKKVAMAHAYAVSPIFCVQGKETPVPEGVKIVAYEPVTAIGTGNPDTPESAEEVAKYLKEEKHIPYVLYGGSVTSENVHAFTGMEHIDGVLVGGASLDAHKFSQLVKNA